MGGDRLTGKVAIVTGATSGIGRCTAEFFVAQGAHVVLAGRREALGRSIAQSLGERASFLTADVEHEDQVRQLVEGTKKTFGRVDILVNNAGGPATAGPIAHVSSEDFDEAVRLLLRSVFYGIKYAAPIMCAQNGGVIISNASVAAHLGGYASSHLYSALKAAVLHLSRSVALELAESNVRVNTVSPGAIATSIFARGAGLSGEEAERTTGDVAKRLSRAQPIARAGRPEDVAAAIMFLASDEASFITGRDLVVDGGLIAGRRFSEVQAGSKAWRKTFLVDGE
jgi:NAD(P)-dependent dehydrogenase (short-subunit alcohol dehydrogenase family)